MKLICPTEAQLREFLEGSSVEFDGSEISTHINDCPSCHQALSDIESEHGDVLEIFRKARTEDLLREPEYREFREKNAAAEFADVSSDSREDAPLGSGKRLRDYRLVRKIGEGGMGTVYQAVHVHLAKAVALKILPADRLQSQQSVDRFRQEMRAVGRVNHPNVVSASDAGKFDGQHFLVMELVQGADLARIIHDRGVLSVGDACEIVRQAAIGIQHAHDSGLVHRDVKPSNVMLTTDGSVKLLDLGLASLNKTDFEASANIVVKDGLTSVGQIMGTLDYMAPEQITANPDVDHRADIYALGATLFQLLTGKTPCGDRAQGTAKRIDAILNEPPLDVATVRSDVPVELQSLIRRMLAKTPEHRPQTASDVADEIAQFASGADVVVLAESCRTSLDMPSVDVDITDEASFMVSRMVEPTRRRISRTAIGVFGAFAALFAAAVFYIATNNGVVKVEVLDESFQVAIDGDAVAVTEEGNSKPIKLRVGDHKLTVNVGGEEFVTSDFEIRRNDKVAICIEPVEGKVIVTRNGTQVASRPMPGIVSAETSNDKNDDAQVAKTSPEPKVKLLTDLPASDLSAIYQALTGAELGGSYVSDKPNPGFANDLNILLANKAISRDAIAKHLVEQGRPDLAEYVLVDGRIKPSATEALKLADLLVESGDAAKAIDSYLQAFRIAPLLFDPWDHIEIFDKHNRLKDLAELFTEERIRETKGGSVDPLHYLLKRLMKKEDLRTSVGMPLMDRLWRVRPDMRIWVFDETKWDEVPNLADYFADVLIPKDIEKVGNGWGAMYGDVQGGWLSELQKVLDEPTTRELIDRIKPNVEEHENWLAGAAMLAVLEALNGNCEPAKRLLEDKENTAGMEWYHKKYLGLSLQGKDRELDEQITKLYEASLVERNPKSPYRVSPVHELAKLYHKFGRKQDALDLMYGLVERESKVEEYLFENWGNPKTVNLDHERIWDLRTAVNTLNSIGYPLDSLLLLSRVTFEQRRAAGVYKGGGWEYDDKRLHKVTSKSQELLNTNAIVEALNRGVIPIGLASTLNKESGEIENPIVELLEQVARKELSAETSAAFESVNAKLADVDAMDAHLVGLMQQQPANVDIAVAAAIFACLRNDIKTATRRLEVVDSITATDHKARASDVNLHLAAEHATSHDATAEIGARLAKRAAESGKQMNDEWKQFFAPPARRQKSATAMPIKQRIKMELSVDELRQLTDELLEIYRDGPGGLPRDQIGGDKLVFNVFKKAGRLVELGECIGETADESGASDLVTARETIEALMNDAETRPLAYRTLEKVFKVSHDVRSQALSFPQGFGADWKTAPNFIVYLRASLLPTDLTRYQRPFSRSLFSQQKALHEFTDEVRALTGKPKSRNGRLGALLLLAVLESEIGNLEAAEKIINEQFIGPDGPTLGSENAMTLAYGIVGKNEALDRLAMKLWESKISVQRDALAYRPLPDLARLYGKYGRKEEARQLLYGLVSPTNQHPLLKGYRPGIKTSCRRYYEQKCSSCHQGETNLTDYTVLSDGLMDLGYPVDSYISLARIDASFRNVYSSTKGWLELTPAEKTYDRLVEFRNESYDYLFKRRVAQASQKVTPKLVIEALRLGAFEKSPRYTKESYESLRTAKPTELKQTLEALELEKTTDAVIDLMLSVRGVGPEAKATVFSPVIEVLKLAADFEGEGAEEDKDRLDALLRLQSELNPNDVQAAIASTAFAFLRNDLATAKSRLEVLQRMELSNGVETQKANACLWLAARYALADASTRSLGERLAEKALTAAKLLPTPIIKEAIHRELPDFNQSGIRK